MCDLDFRNKSSPYCNDIVNLGQIFQEARLEVDDHALALWGTRSWRADPDDEPKMSFIL